MQSDVLLDCCIRLLVPSQLCYRSESVVVLFLGPTRTTIRQLLPLCSHLRGELSPCRIAYGLGEMTVLLLHHALHVQFSKAMTPHRPTSLRLRSLREVISLNCDPLSTRATNFLQNSMHFVKYLITIIEMFERRTTYSFCQTIIIKW